MRDKSMLYIKSFHLIAMVAWFAGIFYLPRLFVYHAEAVDAISIERFKIMERRLYYGITWPAAVLTTVLGIWLLTFNLSYYLHAGFMHVKLTLVVLLWIYHLSLGHYVKIFKEDRNQKSALFYRFYNEAPVLLLVPIVLLVIVKPF
jgi:protoporphyrinogen IX oxidase